MRFITFGLLLLSFFSFAQKSKKIKNKISKKEYETFTLVKEKGQPAYRQGTYTRYMYYVPIEQGTYEHNKKTGKWWSKTSSGYQEHFYSLGLLDSFYGTMDEAVVSIKYAPNGKELSKYYHISPARIVKIPTATNGIKYAKIANHGFIENDTIASGIFWNDKMEGDWQFKNSDGSHCFLKFKNGNLVGPQISYYANGNVYSTLNYDDSSELHGSYFIRYENGDTLFYQNYINGRQDGYGTAKYKNGKTFFTANYTNGYILNYSEYLPPSTDILPSNIRNGKGILQSYAYKNGILEIENSTTFENGLLNGPAFNFNGDSLRYSKIYKNGIFTGYVKKPNFDLEPDDSDTLFMRLNFDVVDTMKHAKSTFTSGEEKLYTHIAENITYPYLALENDAQGTVLTSFTINRLGEVSKLKTISKTLGFGLEEEAHRVVKTTSEQWNPAVYYGIPVPMRFTLPLKFQLF